MRALAMGVFFLVAGSARAQSDPAADHYRAGVAHYKSGQYADAVSEFRAADAIRPSPVLSFNIAQCYEKLADLPNAKAAYQDYLRRAPNADDRAAVEATLASISQKLAQQERDNSVILVPSQAPAVVAGPSRQPSYALGLTVASVGAAALIAGIVLNAVSRTNSNSLQNNGIGGYWTQPVAQGYYNDAQGFWTGALVGYIAGGVLLASGVGFAGYQYLSRPAP